MNNSTKTEKILGFKKVNLWNDFAGLMERLLPDPQTEFDWL